MLPKTNTRAAMVERMVGDARAGSQSRASLLCSAHMKAIELSKTFDPKSYEDRIYSWWMERHAFAPSREPPRGSGKYVIVIPPPNVTGVLHMGHGLNNSLQDIVVRYHRMIGEDTLWVPGCDHRRHRHPARGGEDAEEAGHQPSRPGAREVRGRDLEGHARASRHHREAAEAPRLLVRLGAGALHAGRGTVPRSPRGVRLSLREGTDLPRVLPGELVSDRPNRHLGRRSGARGDEGQALALPLPACRRLRLHHDRHHPARDDARRHRGCRPPRRRALRRPGGEDGGPAAHRTPDPHHRGRAGRAGVRHGRGEGDARP